MSEDKQGYLYQRPIETVAPIKVKVKNFNNKLSAHFMAYVSTKKIEVADLNKLWIFIDDETNEEYQFVIHDRYETQIRWINNELALFGYGMRSLLCQQYLMDRFKLDNTGVIWVYHFEKYKG